MTKRIVSGIFILTALGALGVILAGALTSGEQLIVRFLTAVIVAALGLYVISDLRLQADDDAVAARPGARPRLAGIDVPPNSTAAFMATVTGKGDAPTEIPAAETIIQDALAEDEPAEPQHQDVGAASSSTSEPIVSAVVEDAGSPDGPPVPSVLGPAPVTVRAAELPDLEGSQAATITDLFARRGDGEHTDEPGAWPSVGGGIGFERHYDADDASTTVTDVTDVMASDHLDLSAPDGEIDTDAATDPEGSDEPVEPIAVTDYEYSGDLDAPDFEWPAAPVEPSPPAEVPAPPAPAPAMVGATPADGDEEADLADAESVDTAGFDTEVSNQPVTEEADGELLTAAVNGVERPLPSPFLDRSDVAAADYADAPLAPIIDLRDVTPHSGPGVEAAIRSGELEVISALIEQGMLSTDGPISDRDVRTMVYVAFTSNELRKLLLAGGAPDGPNPGIDLGPVELFGDGLAQPPKTLYPGPPPALTAEARSQLG